ncbi:MAG TPA: LUD domain-containing protein [Paenibacillaceae bacterium]
MADDAYRQWLAELDAESRRKQQAFLERLAAKLGRPRVTEPPPHPFRGAPDFWKEYELSPEERIARFIANFQAAGGHAFRLSGLEEAARFIADRARELGVSAVIRQDEPLLAGLGLESLLSGVEVRVWNDDPAEDWIARAAGAGLGVILADFAVAHTASIVTLSARGKGRSVSLLPPALAAIVPTGRLYTRLGEVLSRFDETGREALPAGIHFISGPSRSADIENDLTIGVHGPGIVYALIVDM